MADSGRSRIIPDGWIFKPKGWRGSDASHYFCPATGQIFSTYKALMHYVEYAKKAKVSIYAPDFDADNSSGKRKGRSRTKTHVCTPATRGEVPSKGTKATSAALEQLPSDVGQITVPKSGISGTFPPKSWEEACLPDSKEASPAVNNIKVYRKRTQTGSGALKQLPSDVGQSNVLKFGIGGGFPPKGWKEACPADPEEVFPADDQTKVPQKRTQAGSATLKQHPSDVGQSKVLKFGIGGEFPPKLWKEACPADPEELFPAVDQTKIPCKRTQAGSAALKELPSDVGQKKALKSGIGGEFPPKGWKEECLADPKEVFPATKFTKVYHKRTQAGSAALKQLPSDVGQNKVLKFGVGGEFPSEGWKEACPADPAEVFPAVDNTKVTCKTTQAGSAALEQLPSDIAQNKTLKFGIGGGFPPEEWKEAYPVDPEEVFPAIDHTKCTLQRTQAGSSALKQLPSAVGNIKVPKFEISENVPCKKRKEAYPSDAKELSPDVKQTKVPMVAMKAEFLPERREEACWPDLKELSPGGDRPNDQRSALGVEYPPKRLREGYLQLSPDQTSIWSTPAREKLPPRRKNSKLGAIDESEVNIGSMDMNPMGDFGGVQQYIPVEGGSSETAYDWTFVANIFPFPAGSEAGEEPTISALDSSFQCYMEPSRPYIEHQYHRRDKSTRPTVGQLRKKAT
ncbi:uncharacterized protein LOC104443477 isoform X2 [Eucalyptus grandis]|uniref:uncharacterized protein LOC104443477 isoform X2 n=1 Tax=Eucalyptus grandis TaxID=71139 RepID=UPI00192EF543|nr:uncharacterized protein LOC104443477 isoform X2 [Eucalyptus grandis]